MASPESPRFQSFGSQDVESSEADDRHALSPCVTSPLLDDSMEVISGQSGCLHQWQCWLATAAVVGIILWTLKAHIGVAIMSLATLAEHAGPWGIVATVFALAAWIMLLMPISLFEVLIGHVFPLRTAPPHRDRWHRRHTPLREAAAALWCPRPRRRRWPTPALALQALAVCIAGKILGALGCFVLSQRAKPLVERLMRRHRRLRALERTVHAHPLKATLLVRFSLLPAPIKNYGWGSLGVDFRVFLLATVLEVRHP